MIELKEFFKSDEKILNIPMYPISEVITTLELAGYKDNDDYDASGWQVDFWLTFTKSKTETMLFSGSLWYGNFQLTKNPK